MGGQLHITDALPLGNELSRTHWTGGWVGLRAGVDDMEKRKYLALLGLKLQTLSGFFKLHNPPRCNMVPWLTDHQTEIGNRKIPGSKVWPACKADNCPTVSCEPTV
jgi:hypothetical protein